jgi:hypothetical protein
MIGCQIPCKMFASVLTVAIPTINLDNHKSIFCQKIVKEDVAGEYSGLHRKSGRKSAGGIVITMQANHLYEKKASYACQNMAMILESSAGARPV